MANQETKRSNEKIFKAIERKLSLDDEKPYIEAANKVTAFLKDPRAYYEGGRPLIGNICKSARATLTRLANSGEPFYSAKAFPKELQPRVSAYTVLIETVFRHSKLFVNDHPLNEELIEIFSSVMSPFEVSKSNKSIDQPRTADSGSPTGKPLVQLKAQPSVKQKALKVSTIDAQPFKEFVQSGLPASQGGSLASAPNTLKRTIGISEADRSDTTSGSATPEVSNPKKSTAVTPQQSRAANSELRFSAPVNISVNPPIGKSYIEEQKTTPKDKSIESSLRSTNQQHSLPESKISGLSEKAANVISVHDVDAESSFMPIIAQQSSPSIMDVEPSITNKEVVEHPPEGQSLAGTTTTPLIIDQQPQEMLGSNSSVLVPPSFSAPIQPVNFPSSSHTTASPPLASRKKPVAQKGGTVKPKKKPKLGRTAVVDSKLLQEDLNWYSSKQRRDPINPALPDVTTEHGRAPPPLITPSGNTIADNTSMEGVKMTPNTLLQSGQDCPVPSPLATSATVGTARFSPKDDASLGDARLSESGIGAATGVPPVVEDTTQKENAEGSYTRVEPVHKEDYAQIQKSEPLKTNGSNGPSSTTAVNTTTKSSFGPATIVFVSVNLGQDVGESVNMDFEITPSQRELVSLWQTRDKHDRDTSTGICLSLACYKVEDALESGFDIENSDEELTTPLLQLTPSWPTNARLSADVGRFNVFLAPPVQLIGEQLVDITRYIEGNHVQIRLDHTGDMRGYLFALISHPPTPSQIHELEEQRARARSYLLSLEGLRITSTDVFG